MFIIFLLASCTSINKITYGKNGKTSSLETPDGIKRLYYEKKEGDSYPSRGVIENTKEIQHLTYNFYDPVLQRIVLNKESSRIKKFAPTLLKIVSEYDMLEVEENGFIIKNKDKNGKKSIQVSSYEDKTFKDKDGKEVMKVSFEETTDVASEEGCFWIKAILKSTKNSILAVNYMKFDNMDKENWENIMPGKEGFKYPKELIISYKDHKGKKTIKPKTRLRIKYEDNIYLFNKSKEISEMPLKINEEEFNEFNLSDEIFNKINKLRPYTTIIELINFFK